jgi:HEAT repeat protein
MTPEDIRASLRSDDSEERRRAVAAVAQSDLSDVTALLYEALGDKDWRVRKEAVRAAPAIAERHPLVDRLIAALCDGENVGRRNAALEAMRSLGPAVVQPLVDALPRVEEPARKFLIDAMGDTRDTGVVPVLVRAVNDDPDPNVAAAALDALARIGGAEAEMALRARLRVADPFQRMAALDGLARLGAVVPWEDLAPLLPDRLVRRAALGLLGRTGRREALEPLVEALCEGSPQLTAASARALVQLGQDPQGLPIEVREHVRRLPLEARQSLRGLLTRGDLQGRQAAAEILALARDADGLEGVVYLLVQDALPPGAVQALRAWGPDAVQPLLALHRRSHGRARAVALELAADLLAAAEGQASNPPLWDELRAALRAGAADPEPSVAMAAARSMSLFGEPQDAPMLVRRASRGPEEVSRACGEALEALAGSAPEVVREALEGVVFEGAAGAALARVAARLGGPQTVEQLQTALAADDPQSRRAGVDALAAIGDRRSAEHIAYALTDENVDVQTAAARALGRMRDETGQPLGTDQLLLALKSSSAAVQAAAAQALGEAGQAEAIGPLRELARSEAPGVAVAAVQALRLLRDPQLADLLLEALAHPDHEVVKQALRALGQGAGPAPVARLSRGLEHAAWDVRILAVRLLEHAGGDEAREALSRRLTHEPDPMVQQAIRKALGVEGDR